MKLQYIGIYFSNSFTFIAWIFLKDNIATISPILACINPNSNSLVGVAIFSSILCGGIASNNQKSIINATQPFQINTWNHIAYTLYGTTATLYINGTIVGLLTNSIFPSNEPTLNNYFGFGENFFENSVATNLILDEVRIYQGTMNYSQIYNDYNNMQTSASKASIFKSVLS